MILSRLPRQHAHYGRFLNLLYANYANYWHAFSLLRDGCQLILEYHAFFTAYSSTRRHDDADDKVISFIYRDIWRGHAIAMLRQHIIIIYNKMIQNTFL